MAEYPSQTKLCEICDSSHMVQNHHICGGNGKRKQHENEHSTIYLCWNCHHGTEGVHGKNGRGLNVMLKQRLQDEYFSMGHSEDEVRQVMGGRLY